ncbi:hypothetical protein E2562_010277 [Oryza meyeriana var. granulata]|uniref:Uncharacterized protein n=1 Tax=Oryza meyeriana var. granulata TaxID=110450 RepID=A0A6G1EHY8_9ORYZ|nr:hypothetical protein E2562_010277 [Oryza meyeriana var. granulata]
MAPPHTTMVIFFMALLLASSSCLAQARMMPSDHAAQVNGKKSSASTEASPQDLLQAVAPPLPPSPAAATATEIIHPESSGWMPQGSVPSPGIGHRA